MSINRFKPRELGAELRLAHAFSESEADLSDKQKKEYRDSRSRSCDCPPDLNDVHRLAAELNL